MSSTPGRGRESGPARRAPEVPVRVDPVFLEPAHRSYADFCKDLQSFVRAPIAGLAPESEEKKTERLRHIKSVPACLPWWVRVWVRVYAWIAVAWQAVVHAGRRARAACWGVGTLACVIFAFHLVRADGGGAVVSLIASVVVLAVFSAWATTYAADQERKASQARQQAEAERPDMQADQVESGRH